MKIESIPPTLDVITDIRSRRILNIITQARKALKGAYVATPAVQPKEASVGADGKAIPEVVAQPEVTLADIDKKLGPVNLAALKLLLPDEEVAEDAKK